jgi:copper(I)-binding protein
MKEPIMKNHQSALAALALTLTLAACQQPAPSASSAASTVAETASVASLAPGITISDARIRAPLNGKTVTAGYVSIANGDSTEDQLVSATSPAFARVELHSSTKSADGMMQMDNLETLPIPAQAATSMAPGGLHMMLFDPTAPLKSGDTVEMTLNFAKAGEKKVSFSVVENPVKPPASADSKAKPGEHDGH